MRKTEEVGAQGDEDGDADSFGNATDDEEEGEKSVTLVYLFIEEHRNSEEIRKTVRQRMEITFQSKL